MKKYTLLGHLFEMEDRAMLFLERYVQRIDDYAKTKAISTDILDDIKYSIVEKLYRFETPITEKNVMEVANQLGEPEDIFWDISFGEKTADTAKKNKLTSFLGKERPIIWWVSYWIAKSLNLPVIFVRIVFLVALFVYSTWFWAYLILALFVPYSDKKKTTGKIGNLFFEIMRVVLRLFVIWVLWFLLLGSLGLMWFATLTPPIGNQVIWPWIPKHMYFVGWFVILALIALFIWSLGSLFKKKFINKTVALLSSILIIAGWIVTAGTIYKYMFGWQETPQAQVHTTTVLSWYNTSWSVSGDILKINIHGEYARTRSPFFSDDYEWFATLKVLPATGDQITIVESMSMKAPTEKQLEKNKTLINSITMTYTGNILDVRIPRGYFKQNVPFAFAERYVTIYIPKNITFAVDSSAVRWRGDLNNLAHMQEKIEDGKKYIGYCDAESMYSYDTTENRYVCDTIRRYPQNRADDSYRNEYYDEYGDYDDSNEYDDEYEQRVHYYQNKIIELSGGTIDTSSGSR